MNKEVYTLNLNCLNFECEDINNRDLFWDIKCQYKPLEFNFIKEGKSLYREVITGIPFSKINDQFVNQELALWFNESGLLKKDLDNFVYFEDIVNYYISTMLLIEKAPNKIELFFESVKLLQEKDIEYKSNMNALLLKKGLSLID